MPLLPVEMLGSNPRAPLSADEHARNNLPDVRARWAERTGAERERPPTAQSLCVPKAALAAEGYELSLNRYKEVVQQEMSHRAPREILTDLARIETEIQAGIRELEAML
jgi:type I restriction enzyme M protein